MIKSRLFVVLPAYNEADNLDALLSNLERAFTAITNVGYAREYVIVDDGSSDDTLTILERWKKNVPIAILKHERNQGLGPTIRDGLKRASELADDDDIIFSMDSDNTHPAGLIARMAQSANEGADVVIASRYRSGSRVVGLSLWR